jgi:hypothetical protein
MAEIAEGFLYAMIGFMGLFCVYLYVKLKNDL